MRNAKLHSIVFGTDSIEIQFERFFSVDSPKAIKAAEYDYLNAINYMAPADSAGVGNLCSHYSDVCKDLCLGRESGQAAMVSRITGTNVTRESRERKARYFMQERKAYMCEMAFHVARNIRTAKRLRLTLAVRPNGSTDIAYEGIRFFVSPEFAALLSDISGLTIESGLHTIFSLFPMIQFLDYTKNPNRMSRVLPANYDLTFSRSEKNHDIALQLLTAGINVAVPFAFGLPHTWHGFTVIDGDKHDLRFLDPKTGVVVGLSPKGNKAKRDKRGFILRDYTMTAA
jgi:hypothetical protein